MKIISIAFLKKKLNTNKSIKLREIRLIDRLRDRVEEQIYFNFGDIYSLPDRYISFGEESRIYKESNRPVVILENEIPRSNYNQVLFAPGTSKIHKYEPEILMAKVPPENLRKTTFFLIKFREYKPTRLFNRKLTELSPQLKNKLEKILLEIYGKRNPDF